VALYLQLVSSLISVLFAVNINNGKYNKQERQPAAMDQHWNGAFHSYMMSNCTTKTYVILCELSKNICVTSRFHNAFSIAEFTGYATTPGSFKLTLTDM